jgi:hypothetical protein
MNIFEIPPNAKTAVAIIRMNDDSVIMAKITGSPTNHEALALSLSYFVKIMQLSEAKDPEFGCHFRKMFRKEKLETIQQELIDLVLK